MRKIKRERPPYPGSYKGNRFRVFQNCKQVFENYSPVPQVASSWLPKCPGASFIGEQHPGFRRGGAGGRGARHPELIAEQSARGARPERPPATRDAAHGLDPNSGSPAQSFHTQGLKKRGLLRSAARRGLRSARQEAAAPHAVRAAPGRTTAPLQLPPPRPPRTPPPPRPSSPEAGAAGSGAEQGATSADSSAR
ncbi:PREDICTED: WAS/WASL-interacting protein family member 3-like, partial [Chinchilla lanigera]|uniref:WAS/WASL-interacting protein family member 3-like n=1 Tax=Chinchilla lanigera TaxID=34839 RepID=UPI000696CC98